MLSTGAQNCEQKVLATARGVWGSACLAFLVSPIIIGCGGAEPAAKTPATEAQPEAAASEPVAPPSEAADTEKAAEVAPHGLPEDCYKPGDVCTPDPKFVKKLCADYHPTVALHFFAKSSPFTRGYLTRKTKAWNASGGVSDNSAMLEFDEEVVILVQRKQDSSGMQVSGAGGGFEALRWDGTCVTLSSEEVTLKPPPAAKTAKVEWRYLDDALQEELRKDETVRSAYIARRQECKGVYSGSVSLKCVKADKKLSEVIVEYVREGGNLPPPERLP